MNFAIGAEGCVTIGRRAAIYSGSGFDLGPEARVQIGAFTMINNAQIICDAAIRIGYYGLISWNVVIMTTTACRVRSRSGVPIFAPFYKITRV